MEFVSEDPLDFVERLKAADGPGSGKSSTSEEKTTDPGNLTDLSDSSEEKSTDPGVATGRDIWLIGGGKVNTLFLNAGLIDELILFVMPVVLPNGIDLFNGQPAESAFQLFDSRSWSNGVMELRYSCLIK